MIDILSYQNIKALITAYVKSDPRIAKEGFIWGESKRVIETQLSSISYPMFWVEDIAFLGQAYHQNTHKYIMWDLGVTISENSPRAEISSEEQNLETAHNILLDFLGYLVKEHAAGNIFFDLERFQASQVMVGEGDNNWGWQFRVMVGMYVGDFCRPAAGSLKEVTVWEPSQQEGATVLQMSIDGRLYALAWEAESRAQILEAFAQEINTDPGSLAEAFTDGAYLYIISLGAGQSLNIITSFVASHNWTQILA